MKAFDERIQPHLNMTVTFWVSHILMRDSKSHVPKETSVTWGLKIKEMTSSKQIQFLFLRKVIFKPSWILVYLRSKAINPWSAYKAVLTFLILIHVLCPPKWNWSVETVCSKDQCWLLNGGNNCDHSNWSGKDLRRWPKHCATSLAQRG